MSRLPHPFDPDPPAHTPFFPAWRACLAPLGRHTRSALQRLRPCTLSQLETTLAAALPADLFPKAAAKANSRDRIYTQGRTFWWFLWQALNPHTSCREVVRQIQGLFQLLDGPLVSTGDGAYCRARRRLPTAPLIRALGASAQAADQRAPASPFLQGRRVKVVDGTTLTLADTRPNQKAFAQVDSQKPHCGFPMLRLLVLFSLRSGAILASLHGSLHTAELRLFQGLLATLQRGDILIGDRGFGHWVMLILLAPLGVDFIGRSARGVDGRRRLRRLGPNDWLVQWERSPQCSALFSPSDWLGLPSALTVRIVRGSIAQKGFRVRQITVVTTLLDPQTYSAREILLAYLRRWRLEMCLDDLKTTLGMETLRCQSPEMVEKELLVSLIAHNLIRWTIAQAATQQEAELERISFKGTLDALRQFSQAMSQARSRKKRRRLWQQFLWTLAADLVPKRPGRREPRAVKRHRNKYPRLSVPRRQFRDRPKRQERRRQARLRNPALK